MTRISTAVDVSSFTTDAKFRTWGSTISASLAACGLVQTADTGQINWTTVLKPGVATTKAGYEIWRFDDSLQGTAPIFLRIDYGTGSKVDSPQVWFQVGTGSNGAGSVTGVQGVSNAAPCNGNSGPISSNTTMTLLFTHTDGFLVAYSDTYSNGSLGMSPMFFAVERTRDQSTGAPTAEGMYVWRAVFNSTALAKGAGQAFNFATSASFPEAPTACMPPGDSVNYGGSLFPVYWCGPQPQVLSSLVGYMDAEIANYSTFTAKPIGSTTTRTYIALSNCGTSSLYGADAVTGVSNEAAVRTAFLWED